MEGQRRGEEGRKGTRRGREGDREKLMPLGSALGQAEEGEKRREP